MIDRLVTEFNSKHTMFIEFPNFEKLDKQKLINDLKPVLFSDDSVRKRFDDYKLINAGNMSVSVCFEWFWFRISFCCGYIYDISATIPKTKKTDKYIILKYYNCTLDDCILDFLGLLENYNKKKNKKNFVI